MGELAMQDGMSFLNFPVRLSEANFFAEDPIVIFEILDFLPVDFYNDLASSFPSSPEIYRAHVFGSKKYLQNSEKAFWEILEKAPQWKQLYDFFLSEQIINHLFELTREHLLHRPASDRNPWELQQPYLRREGLLGNFVRAAYRIRGASRLRRLRTSIGNHLRPLYQKTPLLRTRANQDLSKRRLPFSKECSITTKVEVGFEFSFLGNGDSIPPHTDQPSKLLSLMIYFPETPDQSSAELGTEYWRGKDGTEAWRVWDSGMPDDDDSQAFYDEHEMYHQSPFRGNMLTGFIKSDLSWHGLRPVKLSAGGERRALVINVFLACRR